MKVFTAQEMNRLDVEAGKKFALAPAVLMENAALRVVELLEAKCGPLSGRRIVVFCGKGNNGGDGLAVARHLTHCKAQVSILLAGDPGQLQGEALANYKALQASVASDSAAPAEVLLLTGKRSDISPAQRARLERTEIAIDALLGTGFRGAVRDKPMAHALAMLKANGGLHFAVDLPSALDANSGEAAPEAVAANYTLTMAAPKPGLLLQDGIGLCGEIWVGGIGTPARLYEEAASNLELLTPKTVAALAPHRAPDAHKGDTGRVVLVGGSVGLSGAPCLAAIAALRSGAGLCIACLPASVQPIFAGAVLEATSHALECDETGAVLASAAAALAAQWKGAQVVALGPGLSRADGALGLARHVVRECPLPLLIDADALYALRAIAGEVAARQAPTILTPHPGEMGELLNMPTKQVNATRMEAAARCAKTFNAIVVLKGARSIIALPGGKLYFNPTGNAGMATGGSGDTLTGIIAGLLAQLRDATAATLCGVYLHGLAGDIAYRKFGNGLVAGDISACLPEALLAWPTLCAETINSRLTRIV